MEIGPLHSGEHYKILKAEIPAGGRMPTHYATSEAFIIVTGGRAEIIFSDQEVRLQAGSTFLIPARKPHTLNVIEDFKACIILAPAAGVEFAKNLNGKLKGSKISY
jgi:quercetin dioxygenase-like cupin family protein